jgi:hypothetical protein
MREEHRKRRVYNWPRATIHHGSPKFHKVPRRIESDHRSKEQSRSGIEDPAFWHQPPRTQTHNPSTQLPLLGSDTTLASLIISSTFDLLLLLATGVCVWLFFASGLFSFSFIGVVSCLIPLPGQRRQRQRFQRKPKPVEPMIPYGMLPTAKAPTQPYPKHIPGASTMFAI